MVSPPGVFPSSFHVKQLSDTRSAKKIPKFERAEASRPSFIAFCRIVDLTQVLEIEFQTKPAERIQWLAVTMIDEKDWRGIYGDLYSTEHFDENQLDGIAGMMISGTMQSLVIIYNKRVMVIKFSLDKINGIG